jgi:phosphoribosylamine--glycine ligase
MKYNFLFISWSGLIGDIAYRIVEEGHEVKYYIDAESEREIGNGFVPKVDSWKDHVDWADVIVFDDVLGHGALAEELRAKGKKVIGGTAYTDKLEDDRSFGQEELKKFGVSIITYSDFTSFDEAITYVKENPSAYVIKPSGEAQNTKRLLFVGNEENGSDVIRMLEAYKRSFSDKIKQFQLQKRVMGVEVAVGAFFNGLHFISPININFENKKLFPGNLGPPTGEMGTSMFWSQPNRLFNLTLKKMESKLKEEGFVGYIDLNCIVSHKGVYPLEFTSRFGYPTINIQQDSFLSPIGEFFYNLAHSKDYKLKTKAGFHIGVRVCMPPFPFEDKKTFDSYSKDALIVFKKPNKEGVHFEDVRRVDDQWLVAGSTGVVLVVCGSGPTMKQAQAQAYNRVKNILIPNMYYRKDIGDRWAEDSDKLHNWGYLREV